MAVSLEVGLSRAIKEDRPTNQPEAQAWVDKHRGSSTENKKEQPPVKPLGMKLRDLLKLPRLRMVRPPDSVQDTPDAQRYLDNKQYPPLKK